MLAGEQRVVVLELQAEERIGLDEGTATRHGFSSALGNEIESREFFEEADGSAALRTVTALVSRMFLVRAAARQRE